MGPQPRLTRAAGAAQTARAAHAGSLTCAAVVAHVVSAVYLARAVRAARIWKLCQTSWQPNVLELTMNLLWIYCLDQVMGKANLKGGDLILEG